MVFLPLILFFNCCYFEFKFSLSNSEVDAFFMCCCVVRDGVCTVPTRGLMFKRGTDSMAMVCSPLWSLYSFPLDGAIRVIDDCWRSPFALDDKNSFLFYPVLKCKLEKMPLPGTFFLMLCSSSLLSDVSWL